MAPGLCLSEEAGENELNVLLYDATNHEVQLNLHICPRAIVGLEVVTIKTKGCIFTYGLKRCQKYDIFKNWPSPLRNPIFSTYTY